MPPEISSESAAAYAGNLSQLIEHVDAMLLADQRVDLLLGGNPRSVALDNHRNHARFLSMVFTLHAPEILEPTIEWVYRSYLARGVSPEYFLGVLRAFAASIERVVPPPARDELRHFYEWMIAEHGSRLEKAAAPISEGGADDDNVGVFVSHLLSADTAAAVEFALEYSREGGAPPRVFDALLRPAMYSIGRQWELGRISVAHEHVASSIVGRIIPLIEPARSGQHRGDAIVTCAASEYHELGAQMVADMLSADGWRVRYCGANTPIHDVVQLARSVRPRLVAISVGMVFNLLGAKQLVDSIRADDALGSTAILAGGAAFGVSDSLWRRTGADGYARSAGEAVTLAARLTG